MSKTIDIKDIEFYPVSEEDTKVIKKSTTKDFLAGFLKKAVILIIIYAVILVAEIIGRNNRNIPYTIPYMIAFCTTALVFILVAMAVSGIFKIKFTQYTDRVFYVDATVTKLLGKKQILMESKETYNEHLKIYKETKEKVKNEYLQAVEEYKAGGKNAKKPVLEKNKIPPRPKYHFFGSYRTNANHPNYVFFKTDQGECSTAVVCKNIFLFNRLSVDKKIKLLKHKEINGDTLEIAVVE